MNKHSLPHCVNNLTHFEKFYERFFFFPFFIQQVAERSIIALMVYGFKGI